MSALTRLIDQFMAVQQTHRENAWRMADLAADIHRVAGRAGLQQLSAASHLSLAHLRRLVRAARRFPAGTRDAGLSLHHHIAAAEIASRFDPALPEHEPHFWLREARVQGYTSVELEQAARRHVPRASSLADRQALAAQRVAAAERARKQILALLQEFNAVHAVFWGATLVLSEQPVLAPAS